MEKKFRRLKSHATLVELINDYWKRAKQAKEEGKLIAWSSALAPTDLFTSMDIFMVFPENYGATCGTRKVSTEFVEASEKYDYSISLCSYAKNTLGVVLDEEAAKKCPVGGMPRPDLLVVCSQQCITITKWFEALARFFDIPLLVTDAPYLHEPMNEETKQDVFRFIKEQLEEQVSFLEEFTGRKFSRDRLSESMKYTQASAHTFAEALRMARHIPAPMSCYDGFIHIFPLMCLRGMPAAVSYYEQLKGELEERLEQGIGAVPEEKYRLYWDNLPIWFKMGEHSEKLTTYGACIVMATYFYNWLLPFENLDPSNPIDSLAQSLALTYINRDVSFRIDFIAQAVEDYKIDGLIMQSTRSCHTFHMGQFDIIEALEKRGVPGIMLDADMCDARFYSDAQMEVRLQAFMELLEARKATQ